MGSGESVGGESRRQACTAILIVCRKVAAAAAAQSVSQVDVQGAPRFSSALFSIRKLARSRKLAVASQGVMEHRKLNANATQNARSYGCA